jgi:hypothetical protein
MRVWGESKKYIDREGERERERERVIEIDRQTMRDKFRQSSVSC